jgi:hypothetical protein
MPPGVESWVWLNDFVGFGLADCNPALARSFIELTGTHYPERLGQLLVLDAPGIMTPVWNMVKPFVDPATHKKVRAVLRVVPHARTHTHTLAHCFLTLTERGRSASCPTTLTRPATAPGGS